MSLDDHLRRAFRREEPDPGFAARTMAFIEQRSVSGTAHRFRRPALAWAAIAAAMLLLVINGLLAHQRTLRAREEVELGLRVAIDKLNQVQMKLVEASVRRGVQDAR